MTTRTDPSGIEYGWDAADTGWGDAMNANLQRLSQIGSQPKIKGAALSAPPATPSNGDIHIVGSSPTGAWSTYAVHSLAIYSYAATAYDNLGWRNVTPQVGWVMDDGTKLLRYTSTGWVAVAESVFKGASALSEAAIDDDDRIAVQDISTAADEVKYVTVADLQANWTATSGDAGFIKNKPTLGPQAPATTGNADKYLGVNSAATALEYKDAPSGGSGTSIFKGDWSGAGVAYTTGDIVEFRHEFYMCDLAHTSTTLTTGPTFGATWRTRWHAISSVDIGEIGGSLDGSAIADSDKIAIADVSTTSDETKFATVGSMKSDWTQTNSSRVDFIKNKPTLGPQLPATTGQGGKFPAVNSGGTAIEYVDAPSGGSGGGSSFTTSQRTQILALLPEPAAATISTPTVTGTITARDVHGMAGSATAGAIFGGHSGSTSYNDFHTYSASPTAVTFTALTRSMRPGLATPSVRFGMGMIGDESSGVIFAGQHSGTRYNDFYLYSTTGNEVSYTALTKTGTGSSISARANMGMVGAQNPTGGWWGIIWGGSSSSSRLNDIYVFNYDPFDFNTGQASTSITITALTYGAGPTIPVRESMGVVANLNAYTPEGASFELVVYGGRNGATRLNDAWLIEALPGAPTLTHNSLTVSGGITARSGMGMVGNLFGGLLFGGENATTRFNNLYRFEIDVSAYTFTVAPFTQSTISARRDFGFASGDGNSAALFGGHNASVNNNFYVIEYNGPTDGAEENVQANYTQTDNEADDYIRNKPFIGAQIINPSLTDVGKLVGVNSFGDQLEYQSGYYKVVCLTQTAYDALSTKAPNTIYLITS